MLRAYSPDTHSAFSERALDTCRYCSWLRPRMPRRAWMCLNYATGSPRLLKGLTLTATFTLLFDAIFAPSVARRP